MSFTDQKRRVATAEDLRLRWGGRPDGPRWFRCYLCGHKFALGDGWRWLYSKKHRNFIVCDACDGPDVHERWAAANEEIRTRFWWVD